MAFTVAMLLLLFTFAETQDKYPDIFDELDMKPLLADEERMAATVRCLFQGEDMLCTTATKSLKEILREIVSTDCAKCTEKQNETVLDFFATVLQLYPNETMDFLTEYDSDRKYRKKYGLSWSVRRILL